MASLLDKLEETDVVKEKPMTNQEYVNDYLAKRLGMLRAEEKRDKEDEAAGSDFMRTALGFFGGSTKADDISNIKHYLDLNGCSTEYEYDNTSRFSTIQNDMQLAYHDRYDEKNDSEFVDKIVEAIGIDPESHIFEDSGFYYPHELIKALADIASSEEGFNKIVDSLKVMFEKSKDIMPSPYIGHASFVRDVKKLDETLDSIVEYGRKHGILEKEE